MHVVAAGRSSRLHPRAAVQHKVPDNGYTRPHVPLAHPSLIHQTPRYQIETPQLSRRQAVFGELRRPPQCTDFTTDICGRFL